FDADFVERGLHRVEARRREMREVAFGGRARHVELGDQRADRLAGAARDFERRFVLVGPNPERRNVFVGVLDVYPQRLERVDVGIELRFPGDDGRAQLRDAPACRVEVGSQGGRPRVQVGRGLLEALYFGGQARGALDHGGVGRARLGGTLAETFGRFPRLEQTPLRLRQPLAGALLLVLQANDRRARLFLTAIQRL